MGRGRRQGRGLPEASESENLETDSTRPAPPEGGAANLQATASAADPSSTRRGDGWMDRWVSKQVLLVFGSMCFSSNTEQISRYFSVPDASAWTVLGLRMVSFLFKARLFGQMRRGVTNSYTWKRLTIFPDLSVFG